MTSPPDFSFEEFLHADDLSKLPPFGDTWLGNEDSDKGLLLLHGYTGSNVEMYPYGLLFASEGYRVHIPLLPGHGTNHRDLLKVKYRDWLVAVEKALNALVTEKPGRRIGVSGLSMGGTLSLHLAASFPETVNVVVPMAAPVYLKLGIRNLFRLFRWTNLVVPYREYQFMDESVKNNALVKYLQQNYGRLPVRNMMEVADLVKFVFKELHKITQPILVIHSEHDEVVSRKNPGLILESVRSDIKNVKWVSNSYHVLVADYDREVVAKAALEFMNEHL